MGHVEQHQELSRRLSRREFIKLLLAGGVEAYKDVHDLVRAGEVFCEEHQIGMSGLPESLRVVHLTDLHASRDNDVDMVNVAVCRRVGEEIAGRLQQVGARRERTIFAFTGDGVNGRDADYDIGEFIECMQVLVEMIPADFRFMVPGNHEKKYKGRGDIRQIYSDLRFTALGWGGIDRVVITPKNLSGPGSSRLEVVGTPDYTTNPGAYDRFPEELFRGGDCPMLGLTHNASMFDLNGWGPMIAGLGRSVAFLAGHTHGGQFGNSLFQNALRLYALARIGYRSRLVSGRFNWGDSLSVMVSNGLGSVGSVLRTTPRNWGLYELVPTG